MSEDVIEFGPAVEPEVSQRVHPARRIPAGSALPMAAVAALAAIASLIGPWQSTTIPYEGQAAREIGSGLAALGPVGAAYVLLLAILVMAVVLALFGQPAVRNTARLAGLALAGSGLAIVASMAYAFSKTSSLADFRLYPEEDLDNVVFTLEWGVYVAFAAMLAFGAALVLSNTASRAVLVSAADYEEPQEMDLEVSVYPASPKTNPGTGHELYMRQ